MVFTCPKCQTQVDDVEMGAINVLTACPNCKTLLLNEIQKPTGKRTKKKRTISSWIVVGFGLVALLAIGLFALGLVGYGPLDFHRKERIRAYCDEMYSKVRVISVLMKEKQPGILQKLFNRAKSIEQLQNLHLAIRETKDEIAKREAATDCQPLKEVILAFVDRMERWCKDDVSRAEETMKKDSAAAEAMMETAFKELKTAEDRVKNEVNVLRKKYFQPIVD